MGQDNKMTEKHYTVTDLKSHNNYNFTLAYNSFTVELSFKSINSNEKYQSAPFGLSAFRQKNKIFKQFENTIKIAEVIGSKIEKKQYSLEIPYFILKFRDEFDNPEDIRFDLSRTREMVRNSFTAPSINFSQTKTQPEPQKRQSYKAPTQPPKSATSYQPPKSSTSKLPNTNVVPSSGQTPTLPIIGGYVPPSMDKKGTIFQRIERCKKLKTDMKKNLENIYNRLVSVKKKIDNFVDKAFANNPSSSDKKKALDYMTEVFLLRQGFKDIDNYPEIFQNQVRQEHITFSAAEKEQFDDDMLFLGKAFPYALTPFHQKIDHLFIQVQHNFFKEKNLRFYKDRELADILKTKDKLFNKL
jgi:hypothetical protein